MWMESTVSAFVFRKYLTLARIEENAVASLRELTSVTAINPTGTSSANCHVHPKKNRMFNPMERSAEEVLNAHLTNSIRFEKIVSTPNIVHACKTLVCINIVFPVLSLINGTYFLNTILEDKSSRKVTIMEVIFEDLLEASLFVEACKTPYLHNMMPGSVVLIHDPIFKCDSSQETFSICVPKTDNVVFVGLINPLSKCVPKNEMDTPENSNEGKCQQLPIELEAECKRSETKVKENIPHEREKSNESLWFHSIKCEEKYARDEWKAWGDDNTIRRKHSNALVAYSVAQRFQPNCIDLIAAKCASLISLGMFSEALKEVHAILEHDPDNSGVIMRKAHCLWGLGKYNEALTYSQECYKKLLTMEGHLADEDTIRKGSSIHKIISKTEKLLAQSESLEALDNETLFTKPTQVCLYEPDYYANISFEDGGQFVIAKEDIPEGTILARMKAYSVVFHNNDSQALEGSPTDDLINLTMQKLTIEKPSGSALCSFKDKVEGKCCSDFDEMELSLSTIVNFCERHTYTSYYYNNNAPTQEKADAPGQSRGITRGVWTFPTHVRHACVGVNAIWYICGNLMFVRSIAPIKKSEKVIMAHVDPTKTFEARTQFLLKKGIKCSCEYCKFECNEPDHVRTTRAEIVSSAEGLLCNELSTNVTKFDIAIIQLRLEEVKSLRAEFPNWNIPIVELFYNFGYNAMRVGFFDEAIQAFLQAFHMIENTTALFMLSNLALLLSYCFAAKTRVDKGKSKKWFSSLKFYANLCYGSLTPFSNQFKIEFDCLKRKGIAT